MKKLFLMALAVATITACTKNDNPDTGRFTIRINGDTIQTHATITFACQGFELQPFGTRAELKADGKAMTDLWVLDYPSGQSTPSIQLHQTSSDDDFATPTLNLSVGSHHIYFIASRGSGATLSTENHAITFTKVLDTFYKDYELNVTASSNGSRTVTLDRCVTKLTAIITDAIPEGAATFNMIPASWHYGWDYINATPTTATASQNITINIPASEIGVSNEPLNIYGFSSAAEWTTDVNIYCKTSDGTVLGSATLTDVPLKQNRITTYSGPLFSSNGQTTVSLNPDWDEPHTDTW